MHTDLAIIGGGAAGLAAAIFAGEHAHAHVDQSSTSPLRIVIFEGARKPGAKILVSGGGRCNVTNTRVTPEDFHGGPRPLIRSVLKSFGERDTLAWMAALGVELKLEPTGKYFPVSNQARSVLDALLRRCTELGIELRLGARVAGVRPLDTPSETTPTGFEIKVRAADGEGSEQWTARRVIVATGGLALPKSGSDGAGLQWLTALGHTRVPTTPALVPLLLRPGRTPGGRLAELAGITLDLRLSVQGPAGVLATVTGSTLFTHFGLSGPGPLDISRHLLRARLAAGGEAAQGIGLRLGLPQFANVEAADAWLRERIARQPRRHIGNALADLLPQRMAELYAGGPEEAACPLGQLTRARRLDLAQMLAALPVDVEGDRGYSFAETTAGGIDLREVEVRTMGSRVVPGLHLCGEVLDVDGRIGGFNFQWAWASGRLAGRGAVDALLA